MVCPTCGDEYAYRLSRNGMSIGEETKTWERWYCVNCGKHSVETSSIKHSPRRK